MKKTLIIAQLFVCSTLFAQNLVSNPSFEISETQPCPTLGDLSAMNGWVNPTGCTPDWFLDCITGLIPVGLTNRYPHSGHAFIGLFSYQIANNNTQTGSEYLQQKLSNVLKINHHYYFEMYVVNDFNTSVVSTGCNGMGGLFTTYATSSINCNRIVKKPQFFDRAIVNDTSNWFKISGTFVADSAYQYLTLGNFLPKDSILTDTLYLPPSAQPGFVCYNFIDDISLIDLDATGVDDIKETDGGIAAYPNPTKENINIAFALPANAGTDEMQVFNIVGQQMESRLISQQKGVETFSVSKYQNGCYIAKMKQHPDLWVKFNVLNNF